jgi:hypothetical protein
MNIKELIDKLEGNPNFGIDISFPDGEYIPPHFHITEVGKVQKMFIDCGGVRHEKKYCVLQVWTADDFSHRIKAGKLAEILKKSLEFIEPDLLVEIEYGQEVVSNFTLKDVLHQGKIPAFVFNINPNKTDCLAKEKCGINIINNQCCC